MNDKHRLRVVVVYAVAMAWVEAAVVYYLRTMMDRIEPRQPNPLPVIGGIGPAEVVRELATMVMLLTVGILAGRTWRSRLGYTALAFGVWDIFYYVFLKMICGWPHSLLDWDVLFLIPMPWWGPVLAPMLISGLMIVWGTLASQTEGQNLDSRVHWRSWVLSVFGMVLALYVFMADAIRADAIRVAGGKIDLWRDLLPIRFKWELFGIALVLMSAPIASLWLRLRLQAPQRVENQRNEL
jgi:hypothetical protein